MFIITNENTDRVYYTVYNGDDDSLSLIFRVFRKSGKIDEAKICTFHKGFASGFNNYLSTIKLGKVDLVYKGLDVLPSPKYETESEILFFELDLSSNQILEVSKEDYMEYYTTFKKEQEYEETN